MQMIPINREARRAAAATETSLRSQNKRCQVCMRVRSTGVIELTNSAISIYARVTYYVMTERPSISNESLARTGSFGMCAVSVVYRFLNDQKRRTEEYGESERDVGEK